MAKFKEFSEIVEKHLVSRYGIRIVTRDVADPLIGDLDGAEIHIDHAVTDEQRLFLLAHLFGHTVQWNTHPNAAELGRPQQPPVAAPLIPALIEYEREAAGYALRMLHEAGVNGLDQWLSDYSACDCAYLHHYYCTGQAADFQGFWKTDTARIEPLPIPSFEPKRHGWRTDGIVI
jgi:hypothetical protein